MLTHVVVGVLSAALAALFVGRSIPGNEAVLGSASGPAPLGGIAASDAHVSSGVPYYAAHRPLVKFVDTSLLQFFAPSYPLAMVSDLDDASFDPAVGGWSSYYQRALLRRHPRTGRFFLDFGERTRLVSFSATGNRSMELSALVQFRHLLLAVCDRTGLVFKIIPDRGQVFLRYAIADGNGEEAKPFKAEWATVKDGLLFVGSVGRELVDAVRSRRACALPPLVDALSQEGRVVNHNSEWAKSIDANGRIENYDWRPVYLALRTAANASFPGYLWHEAVHWDVRERLWIVAPRYESHTAYSPEEAETAGSNLVLVAAEDFSSIRTFRVGERDPEYGFADVRKVPGSKSLFAGLQVKELAGVTHTRMVVFDLEGTTYSGTVADPYLPVSDIKFEGMEFLL